MTPPPVEVSRGRRSGGSSFGLKDLEYPVIGREQPPEAPAMLRTGAGKRAVLAEALSAAVAREFQSLDEAWDLGAPGERRLEEDVAKFLKHIAGRAERHCVLKTLRQPPMAPAAAASAMEAVMQADEEAALQARHAQLLAQLDASEDRLARLNDLEANVAEAVAGEPHEGLKDLFDQLSREEGDSSFSQSAGSQSESLDQCQQRLGLVDVWFNRTWAKLEEARQELTEKQRSVASNAFAHMGGELPNPQVALARMP